MDYLAWLRRLEQFVARWQARLPPERQQECFVHVDPPLSDEQIEELSAGLDRPLPASVEGFLRQAASRVRFECPCAVAEGRGVFVSGELFHYWLWRPNNNERYAPCPGGMIAARQCVIGMATAPSSWLQEPEWVLDRAFWRHGLPLTQGPTGDCLALWAHDPDHPDPAVVYLSHDDVSYLLAPNFDTFLEQWEHLGYDWGEEYRDPESGLMDMDSEAAIERRELLGLDGEQE